MEVFAVYRIVKGEKVYFRGRGWDRGFRKNHQVNNILPRIFTHKSHIKNLRGYNPKTDVIVSMKLGDPIVCNNEPEEGVCGC